MRHPGDPERYHECAQVLDKENGKTLESLCRLAVQNLQEEGNIPSILIHLASTWIGLTSFGYLNDQKRLVDVGSFLLQVIKSSNGKIETREWNAREVIDLIESGLKLMEEDKKLGPREPKTLEILAGYRTYILSFLG